MAEQKMIGAVASSSNSSSKKYDVFLSFRGEDTRKNFTSHLYEALMQKKVETYIDEQLEKGDEITPALIKAIEDSCVSVVIFSENYASSKWCLAELSKILECKKTQGQIVIPVFYNTDPSHVRKQTGSYGQAFARHEGEPRWNKWKAALTEAANLAGWDSRTYRNDPELLKDIVGDVLRKLPPRYSNQCKGLVGIEENYKQFESLLQIGSSEVRTLGIWGMGGIGKTTLATALYDKLSHEFEDCCFLTNVREKSDKLENHSFDKSEMSKLRGKRVFIVLDDVATSEQLVKLMVDYDFWGPGSRVIVTTRNKQILSLFDEIYEVNELNPPHALQLFCLTVSGENQPRDGYEDLSREVISYCKGIPLALKVLGASLRKRSKEAWECELRKLQKIPNMEIHKVLKLSYDSLDRSQQDIFLDIACFFKGERRDYVTSLLEAFDFFPTSGIEVLLDKALITISYDNHIEMHDLIQEMCWEMVHQESKYPGRRSRLWRHEEVLDVLKYDRGTDVVEGIILDLTKLIGDLSLSCDSLAKMTNVRFLKIHAQWWTKNIFNVHLPSGLDKLRYLRWDNFCLESFPSNFCAEQLVELCMYHSKLRKLWDGIQNLVNLKRINLSWSRDLIEIPDLSKAEKLEIVDLDGCESLSQLHFDSKSLRELQLRGCLSLKEFSVVSEEMTQLNISDTAICALTLSMLSLPKLMHLYLYGCKWIESLNIHLKYLRKLDLCDCSALKELLVASEEMTELDLSCTAIRALSSSMLSLPKLTHLHLNYCREIESVNVHLKSLCVLNLNGCSSLNEILVTSEKMTQLNLVDTSIRALPSSIGHLLSLKQLDLRGSNVESLPENLKILSMLRKLWLNDCNKLVSLPKLPPSLQVLCLNDCRRLMSLPELPPSLTELGLSDCRKLVYLPKLPPSLKELCLNGCRELLFLPELPPSLRELYLNDCRELMFLPELPPSLITLGLDDCWKLVYLPELPQFLPRLKAINCTCLETEITQPLVLQHMLKSRIPYLHQQYLNNPEYRDGGYFMFPGDHVTHVCVFRTARSSITIPHLPISQLCGFIYCIILPKGLVLDNFSCSVYQDGILVDQDRECPYMRDYNSISDHVLFWYHDVVSKFEKKSEVHDHLSNITFQFKCEFKSVYNKDDDLDGESESGSDDDLDEGNQVGIKRHRSHDNLDEDDQRGIKGCGSDDDLKEDNQVEIKGCGVFPIYATTSGFELVGSSSKEIIQLGQEKFLPTTKRRRTLP